MNRVLLQLFFLQISFNRVSNLVSISIIIGPFFSEDDIDAVDIEMLVTELRFVTNISRLQHPLHRSTRHRIGDLLNIQCQQVLISKKK